MDSKIYKWSREYDHNTGVEYFITENNICEITIDGNGILIDNVRYESLDQAAFVIESNADIFYNDEAA